jgi:hypothetical protein
VPSHNSLAEKYNQTSFLIRGKIHQQYLCASTKHTSVFFKSRRQVFARQLKHQASDETEVSESECLWRLDKINDPNQINNKKFIIWNLKYDEALYAANSFFNDIELGRNVYTWHKKPDTDQFAWNFHCVKKQISF